MTTPHASRSISEPARTTDGAPPADPRTAPRRCGRPVLKRSAPRDRQRRAPCPSACDGGGSLTQRGDRRRSARAPRPEDDRRLYRVETTPVHASLREVSMFVAAMPSMWSVASLPTLAAPTAYSKPFRTGRRPTFGATNAGCAGTSSWGMCRRCRCSPGRDACTNRNACGIDRSEVSWSAPNPARADPDAKAPEVAGANPLEAPGKEINRCHRGGTRSRGRRTVHVATASRTSTAPCAGRAAPGC